MRNKLVWTAIVAVALFGCGDDDGDTTGTGGSSSSSSGTGGTGGGTGGTGGAGGAGGAMGGPIDGVWALSQTQCNGMDAMSPPFVLTVDNDTGTFVFTLDPTCVVTFDENYAYDMGAITITPTAVSCNTEMGCMALPFPVECTNAPPAVVFDYELVAGDLVFTKMSDGPMAGDPCPAGETLTYTMTAQ